eukprot:4647408-Prymnesium_polylepis.1
MPCAPAAARARAPHGAHCDRARVRADAQAGRRSRRATPARRRTAQEEQAPRAAAPLAARLVLGARRPALLPRRHGGRRGRRFNRQHARSADFRVARTAHRSARLATRLAADFTSRLAARLLARRVARIGRFGRFARAVRRGDPAVAHVAPHLGRDHVVGHSARPGLHDPARRGLRDDDHRVL